MAVIVLVCRLALGGLFLLLGVELAYGVLPPELVPGPLQQLLATLSGPTEGSALSGTLEFIAGLMIFSGMWVPLGLLLLTPVLLHLGMTQWFAAPESLAVVGSLYLPTASDKDKWLGENTVTPQVLGILANRISLLVRRRPTFDSADG